MSNNNSESTSAFDDREEIPLEYIKKKFDGIRFLWKIPETRFFLKLIMLLLSVQVLLYGGIYFLILLFGESWIFLRIMFIGEYLLFGLFFFIVINLFLFYVSAKKHKFFPERNKFLTMKWISTKSSNVRKIRVVLLIGCVLFSCMLIIMDYLYFWPIAVLLIYGLSFLILFFIPLIIMFILAFFTVKGTMEDFEKKHLEQLKRKPFLFLVFLPLPWIMFFMIVFIYILHDFSILLGTIYIVNMHYFLYIYIMLIILSIAALIVKKLRIGFTLAQVATSSMFLFIFLIPFIIGLVIDLFGLFISFFALCFFFIQGTLDEKGDELRQYYSAWERKLEKFHVTSEEDICSQNYDRTFDKTKLETDVPNAYLNVIIGLMLIVVTFFGIFSNLQFFAVLGTESGIIGISNILNLMAYSEVLGYVIATFIFIFLIIRRQIMQDKIDKIF